MTTCFPSIAPEAVGKIKVAELGSYLPPLCCIWPGHVISQDRSDFHIAAHTSFTIPATVLAPTLKPKATDRRESPVAKYL